MDEKRRFRWLKRALCSGMYVTVLWSLCDPFSHRPDDWGLFNKLFGENPSGIPTRIAAPALISLLILPWAMMIGYGFDLGMALKNRGYRHPGLLSMSVGALRNWRQPDVRGPVLKILLIWAGYMLAIRGFGHWLASTIPL